MAASQEQREAAAALAEEVRSLLLSADALRRRGRHLAWVDRVLAELSDEGLSADGCAQAVSGLRDLQTRVASDGERTPPPAVCWSGWCVHPPLAPLPAGLSTGDEVFVKLRSDKETGAGEVLELGGEGGRILVRYLDGSGQYWCNPRRVVRVQREGVVVTYHTAEFRMLCYAYARAACVVELGCSFGGATEVLARVARRVVATDVAEGCVEATHDKTAALGDVRCLVADALTPEGRSRVREACGDLPCDAVFVDVGGNRCGDIVRQLVQAAQSELRPKVCVVKCEEVHTDLVAALRRQG
eukprot:TRINITY_DN39437_c0_g1_i1.p1 TRINITY_DN39437_c0_g1~~TRINITY_DN39437_c0_g1_i1.p1  ORF type:complete len:299 (+),score=75.06 TRINITY_DN39437_c0_g1_i1:56-952(+)